jgi:hypothetical protein
MEKYTQNLIKDGWRSLENMKEFTASNDGMLPPPSRLCSILDFLSYYILYCFWLKISRPAECPTQPTGMQSLKLQDCAVLEKWNSTTQPRK